MSRVAATRAVAHWAWRMFRRDWRGQSLVLVLLTVAVAVSSYGASLGHALAPSDQASFGTASGRIRFTTAAPASAAVTVAAARHAFGTVEEITDRLVAIPGSVRQLDLRTQDPHGAFGSSTLRLRAGRYPSGPGEIALTPATAQFLAARVGGRLALATSSWRVVGLVENPARLDDAFGLVTAAPQQVPARYTLLVRASPGRLAAFRAGAAAPVALSVDTPQYYSRDLGVLLVAALGMIVVAVLALTAFLVLAQRRVRQLGMLAAIGATRRQVRDVTVIHGLIVGGIAAGLGTAAAAACWALTGSLIAQASGRRSGWGAVPLWLIVAPGLMGILASALAAWWPARTMARTPIVRALSNRPPESAPGRRSAAAAGTALAIGVLCLRFAHQRNALLMIVGLAAMIGSVLLTTPLAVRALTARSGRLPVTGRLAWRELGRNQARTAAALATVATAVGISVAAVVVTAANTHPATAGNLSDRQLLIRAAVTRDPALVPRRLAALDTSAAAVAAAVPGAGLVALDAAVDPGAPPTEAALATGTVDAAQVVRAHGGALHSEPVYVADPALLAALGAAPGGPGPQGLLAADPTGTWSLLDQRRTAIAPPAALHAHDYTSLPQVLITPAALAARHWQRMLAGWLLHSPAPITAPEQRAVRARAAALGLSVESRDPQAYLGRLRLVFTAGGIVVTLAVIAVAIVLLRLQSVRDQQLLTALGASGRTRRAVAAITATALAATGTVLGTAGAYATLALAYSDTPGRLGDVPWSALATIGAGIPVLALVSTWLTAGRRPPAINRPVLD